jgi:SAM-dependent methyltransferase
MKNFDKYSSYGAYHWRECRKWSLSYNPPLHARYLSISKRVKGKCVLDVGAGDGFLSGLMAPFNPRIVSLEYDPDGHLLAKNMLADYSNVDVICGSAYDIPFPEDSFDVVVHADVIEHLEHPRIALSEFARVLRPSGFALISTPLRRASGKLWDPRHLKEYDPIEFRELLETYFKHVEITYLWPKPWFSFYETKLGWRILKLLGSLGFNPFTAESSSPANMHQMLGIARL